MWAKFKRTFTNKLYKSLDEVSMFIQIQNLKNDETRNTCAFDYIFLNHFWNKKLNRLDIIHRHNKRKEEEENRK
jgi:hypothetical protein